MEFDVMVIVVPSEDFENFTNGVSDWTFLAERVSESEAERIMANAAVEAI